MKKFVFYPALALLLFSIQSFSLAKSPIKFGKVSLEELEMASYSPDPEAPAVVLCSYGYYDDESYMFTHVFRVKILKKGGFDFANRKFSVSKRSDVKGRTFNLVDGEVVEDKLSKESIFLEKITEDFYYVNVAMPNVKEGSVIDLKISYSGFPNNWYFQEDIPVIHSELDIERPEYIEFRKNFFGYEKLDVNEFNHWVATDVPAFKPEPFMDSRENYITKFEFDITSINIPGYVYTQHAVSWGSLSETLFEAKYFGQFLNTGSYLNKVAKEINANYQTQEEKLKAAVEFVHDNIEFDGKNRFLSESISLSTVYNEHIGNSAEVNLTLIRLLDKLSFQVYPLVLSTKDNGMLSPVFASAQRLNYVIAYVKVNDKLMLVDATDKLLPYYMIPQKCLNWRGRIVDGTKSDWVYLKTDHKDKELVYYDLKLNEDMTLMGKLNYKKEDYAAHDYRKQLAGYNNFDEYVEDLKKDYPDIEIINSSMSGLDDVYKPIVEEYEVQINNKAIQMDNTIYLTLSLFEQIEENPFKAEKRKYPVSLSCPIERSGTIKIFLPDNFKVEEMPKSTRFVMPDKAGGFTYQITAMSNFIMLNYKLTINKTMYVLDEYEYLRAFYNEVIKKEAEPLVITIIDDKDEAVN